MAVTKTRRALNGKVAASHADNIDQVVSDNAKGIALAAIPDKRYFDEYQSRQVLGKNDLDVFDYAINNAVNVLLFGPTGPGKTSAVLAYAAKKRKRFYSVACNLALDPTHMFGKWGQSETGLFQFYDGGITDIIRHGGVILLNEINFMSERIAPVLYELLDKRREITLLDHKGEKVRAHRPDGCWCSLPYDECRKRWVLVIADMNPDYAGTRPLNAAMRNRFAIQVLWDYDPDVEAKLIPSQVLRDIATNIRNQIGKTIETPVSTNMLQEFVRFAADADMGVDFAVINFCNHFTPDEFPAVKAVFEAREDELKDSFVPDQSQGYDQFDDKNSAWMFEEDDEEEPEADDEEF